MKQLKRRRILINPQCISYVCSNQDSSELRVHLSCSGEAAGSCTIENQGKIEVLKMTEFSLLGEDAEAFMRLIGIQ